MVDIPRYEGLYKIDEQGNILSVKRNIFIKQHLGYGGYRAVVINGKDGKQHHEFVHRLLAEAFLPNYDNLPCINHKDENRLNNDLSNLEWCTVRYNNTHNNVHKRRGRTVSETIKRNGGPWNKGKTLSEETKQKISDSCKGHPFRGNQHT